MRGNIWLRAHRFGAPSRPARGAPGHGQAPTYSRPGFGPEALSIGSLYRCLVGVLQNQAPADLHVAGALRPEQSRCHPAPALIPFTFTEVKHTPVRGRQTWPEGGGCPPPPPRGTCPAGRCGASTSATCNRARQCSPNMVFFIYHWFDGPLTNTERKAKESPFSSRFNCIMCGLPAPPSDRKKEKLVSHNIFCEPNDFANFVRHHFWFRNASQKKKTHRETTFFASPKPLVSHFS